jgi:hypothetical protein
MGRGKKTVLYSYKDKDENERVGFISPRKARQVESLKRANKNRITLPEEENKEK